MRKIDKHFSISPDLDNKIKISLKKSKRSYSDELNFIINEYFKEKEELEKILISLDSIISNRHLSSGNNRWQN